MYKDYKPCVIWLVRSITFYYYSCPTSVAKRKVVGLGVNKLHNFVFGLGPYASDNLRNTLKYISVSPHKHSPAEHNGVW